MLAIAQSVAQFLKLVNFIAGWLRDRGLIKRGRAEAIQGMRKNADARVKKIKTAKRPNASLDDDLGEL